MASPHQFVTGGGGGGVGRIRVNTLSMPTLDGTLSPSIGTSAVTTGELLTTPLTP